MIGPFVLKADFASVWLISPVVLYRTGRQNSFTAAGDLQGADGGRVAEVRRPAPGVPAAAGALGEGRAEAEGERGA